MIPGSRWLALVLTVVAASAGMSLAQTRLAPFYALPPDGTCVEYVWRRLDAQHKEVTGILRISAVGQMQVPGGLGRWIEIKAEAKSRKPRWQLRKLLVAGAAFHASQPLEVAVVECYHQDNAGRSVVRLAPKRINDFLGMGIGGDNQALRKIRDHEEVQTALGKFQTWHVATAGGYPEAPGRAYHGWLTRQTPFGVVKFEILEQPAGARLASCSRPWQHGPVRTPKVNLTSPRNREKRHDLRTIVMTTDGLGLSEPQAALSCLRLAGPKNGL
jgi:hypothetical protein